MKLYKISFNSEYALADIVDSNKNVDSLSLNSETPELLQNFRYDWVTDDSSLTPNIAIIMSELFCVDKKALGTLSPFLSLLGQTEIIIGQVKFYSLSNIPVLKDALNLKSSKVKYFSTGDIMEVTKPVFREQEYPNLFKADEIIGSFFCSEGFMNAIVSHNLTGLFFEDCKVKSKSWFRI